MIQPQTSRRWLAILTRALYGGAPYVGALCVGALCVGTPVAAQAPAPIGPELEVRTGSDPITSPEAAVDASGAAVVVWEEGPDGSRDVVARFFDSAGEALVPPFLVSGAVPGNHRQPDVARSADGSFVVTWSAEMSGSSEIFVQRFSPTGVPLEVAFQVNDYTSLEQVNPTVAIAEDGSFVVAWRRDLQPGDTDPGIYARFYSSAGMPDGNSFRVDATPGGGEPVHPSVAVDPDSQDVLFAWSAPALNSFDVLARRIGTDRQPRGNAFVVNSYTTNIQSLPTVGFDRDGNFAIAWRSRNQDGSGSGIYAQRFNSLDTPIGQEFRVHTTTASTQNYPDIAVADTGEFLVVWESFANDGDDYGIFGQRFLGIDPPEASRGGGGGGATTVGGEFQVSTQSAGAQQKPSVALDGVGRGLVAWRSGEQLRGAPANALRAQRFRPPPPAFASGHDFVIDEGTDDVLQPDVATRADGSFVVAWTKGDGASNRDVFVERFDNSAQSLGQPLQVNTSSPVLNLQPRVATREDGSFVVAWWDYLGETARARTFDPNGLPTGIEIEITDALAPSVATTTFGFAMTSLAVVSENEANAQVQRFSVTGVPLEPATILGPSDSAVPVRSRSDGRYLVAWGGPENSDEVKGQEFLPSGMASGVQFTISTNQSTTPSIDYSESGFAVAWRDRGDARGFFEPLVRAQRFDPSGNPVGDLVELQAPDVDPDPVLRSTGSGNFGLLWSRDLTPTNADVELTLLDDALARTSLATTPVPTVRYDDQRSARMSEANGVLTVVWVDRSVPFGRIMGRRFTAPVFIDGVETGDTTRWSTSVP